MKKKRMLILAAAAAVVIGSCSWEIPEEVVFRAQPQLWIPTGGTVFDPDVSDELDEIIDEFTAGITDPNLTAGEKVGGGYDGKPLTLYAELELVAPDFPDLPPVPDFDALLDGLTDPIDLSGLSGPIPDEVQLQEVPGWAWFEPDPAASPFATFIRLRAEWSVGGVPQTPQYLLGDSAGFAALASARGTDKDFDLASVFNDRPADLVLHYEFGANSADVADIDSLHLRFEVPFAFDVNEASPPLLDFEENGDNPLLMEDDIFGRDPADPDEDLDQLLDSLRGSNAGISLTLTQTSGLGARLGMINSADPLFGDENEKKDPANWVIDVGVLPDEVEQTVEAGITEQGLDQMIDGAGPDNLFIPEFVIIVPQDFQINKLWTFTVTEGYLRVQAVIDYNFSLDDEE